MECVQLAERVYVTVVIYTPKKFDLKQFHKVLNDGRMNGIRRHIDDRDIRIPKYKQQSTVSSDFTASLLELANAKLPRKKL